MCGAWGSIRSSVRAHTASPRKYKGQKSSMVEDEVCDLVWLVYTRKQEANSANGSSIYDWSSGTDTRWNMRIPMFVKLVKRASPTRVYALVSPTFIHITKSSPVWSSRRACSSSSKFSWDMSSGARHRKTTRRVKPPGELRAGFPPRNIA